MGDLFLCMHASDQEPFCVERWCSMADGPSRIYQHVFRSLQSRFNDDVVATRKMMWDDGPSCVARARARA
eukprot:12882553-Prorocentrum_lima.AAC.1